MGSLIDVPWWGGSSGSCSINIYAEQGGLDGKLFVWRVDRRNHLDGGQFCLAFNR